MKHWSDITRKEKIARWEQVLRVLRGLTKHERKKHFNMSFFGEKTACGTVACAAGHCGLDPWFRRRGFRLDFDKIVTWNGETVFSENVSSSEDFFGSVGSNNIFFD